MAGLIVEVDSATLFFFPVSTTALLFALWSLIFRVALVIFSIMDMEMKSYYRKLNYISSEVKAER